MALSIDKQNKIKDVMTKYCYDYIPMQEITYACNIIYGNPTQEGLTEAMHYLMQNDKPYIPLQTISIDSIIKNHIRLCIAEVQKEITGSGLVDDPT